MYLNFPIEIILFLAPQDLEMKEWRQLLGSMFLEIQTNNSKSQTTNHTFSFKTGDGENPTLSYKQYLCRQDQEKWTNIGQKCKAEVECILFFHSNQEIQVSLLLFLPRKSTPDQRHFFFFFFFFFRAPPTAYGGSQVWMGAIAASLCHSHSHARSEPNLWPTPQLMAAPDP